MIRVGLWDRMDYGHTTHRREQYKSLPIVIQESERTAEGPQDVQRLCSFRNVDMDPEHGPRSGNPMERFCHIPRTNQGGPRLEIPERKLPTLGGGGGGLVLACSKVLVHAHAPITWSLNTGTPTMKEDLNNGPPHSFKESGDASNSSGGGDSVRR